MGRSLIPCWDTVGTGDTKPGTAGFAEESLLRDLAQIQLPARAGNLVIGSVVGILG